MSGNQGLGSSYHGDAVRRATGSADQGIDPGNTASSSIAGQNIDRTAMGVAQGYVNPRQSNFPGDNLPVTGVSPGTSLDPNVDYFNSKVRQANPEKLSKVIKQYYKTWNCSEFIENISYQGFNRHEYIRFALTVLTVSQFCRFAVMGAIRGSNFQKILDNSLSIDVDLKDLVNRGTIVKTPKRKNDLSILRCTASIPHWCAYFLMGSNIAPKLADVNLPAFLQFPAAASLPMSSDLRAAHIEFSIKFSQLIGGAFNANIYLAAFNQQIPLGEIPDEVRMQLGITSANESLRVSAIDLIREKTSAIVKK